ncbi:MAG: winged helix-turn-helix domain-containing protein [Stenomitos rutilans HA7619-LM2]|nr:winged helix-turn-helix domain-containing protein [Stenomitos rutilans HA7619-LM2]
MTPDVEQQLDDTIRQALVLAATPPQERQAPTLPRWTLKRLLVWVKQQFGIDCCRDTLRKVMRRLGFSWKKAHKLLNKGNPHKRAAFLERLQGLLDEALHQRCLLVYIDEAHIHLDTDAGYGWSIRGQRFWVSSSSPGRAKSRSTESTYTTWDKCVCLRMTRQTNSIPLMSSSNYGSSFLSVL